MRRLAIFLTAIAVLLLVTAGSFAQQLNFKNYGSSEGLPQTQVNAVFQDSRGYLWFGTYAGASRYNGVDFETFDTTNGLRSNSVMDMAEDEHGRLYFATLGGGLTVFDGEGFQYFYSGHGLLSDNVYDIQIDSEDLVWVATAGGLTCLRDGEPTHYSEAQGLDSDYCTAVYIAPDGDLWVGTEDGPYHWDGENFVLLELDEHLEFHQVSVILRDNRDSVWFGTYNGLCRWNGSDCEAVYTDDGMPRLSITSAAQDVDGSLWFGTSNGALHYVDGELSLYNTNNGLCDNSINSVLIDREANIWFGTEGGISKLRHGPFVNYNRATGLIHEKAVIIFEDSGNRLWVGTEEGITILENGEFRPFDAENLLPSQPVNSIAEGTDGTIYIGTSENMFAWDGNSLSEIEDSLGVICLFRDSRGTIWMGGTGASFLAGDHIQEMPEESPLYSIEINCIDEDNLGRLWFGTIGAGCIVYDDGELLTLDAAEGLTNLHIWSIDVDPAGNVWIGTNGDGIFRYDGQTFTNYTTAEGLLNNYVWQVLADSQGNIWFGTNAGLDRYDCSNFRHFTTSDGLAENEGIADSCLEDSRGRLWFGSARGLSLYVGGEPELGASHLPVYIERIVAGRTTLSLDEEYELAAIQNSIAFAFIGLSYRNEAAIRYHYMLEGLDQDWSEVTAERTIRYANIPPGSYTFKVEASRGDDIWSQTPATARFTIRPPFYLTWWFLAMAAVAVFLLVTLGHRWRVQKVRAEKRVLERMVRKRTRELTLANEELEAFNHSVSHDLRAPLGRIEGYGKILLDEYTDALDERGISFLKRICSSSDRMNDLIGALLRLSRSTSGEMTFEEVDLSLLARVIKNDLKHSDSEREVEFVIQDGLTVSGNERLLHLALENLLENAWKYTKHESAARIEVGTTDADGKDVFFVRDNGVGFQRTKNNLLFVAFQRLHAPNEFGGSGLGLVTVKRIIERHGGRIWAEGEAGKGATFYFTLK